ncbi:MAG: cytochrome P450 [Byssovorax sp.]
MLPPRSRLPGFVNMVRWMADPDGSLERDAAHFGDAYLIKSTLFGMEAVFNHPSALKEIFTGDPERFVAGEANSLFGPILGDRSVLLLDGAEHLHVRRMMLPAFHGERMRCYTDAMREITRKAIGSLRPGDQLSLHSLFQRITLDVILSTVLGLDEEGPELSQARDQIMHLLDRVQSPTGAIWMIPAMRREVYGLSPWASIKREIDALDRMLMAHIAARRALSTEKDDVLAMLIRAVDEDGKGLDDRTLCSQLKTLLIAGHETSATSLAWVFEELLRVPGEQARLTEEVRRVTEGASLTAEHLPGLERLDSVIKESLRLHPVTGAVGRILKKPTTIAGYDLPTGMFIVACVHMTHRRADLYPEPYRFLPERFVGKKTDPYEWAPFGGGIRRCLGMAFSLHEMKVIMATMFAAGLRLRLEAKGPWKAELRSLFYSPKGGTKVVVEATGAKKSAPYSATISPFMPAE